MKKELKRNTDLQTIKELEHTIHRLKIDSEETITSLRARIGELCQLPKESEEIYANYIAPLNDYHFRGNWDITQNINEFKWGYLLLYLWYYSHDETWPGTRDSEGLIIVHADELEPFMLQYFDVSVETFRSAMNYDIQSNLYTIEPGAFGPLFRTDISGFTYNDDGTITLAIIILPNDLYETSALLGHLTLMPKEDGTYRYLRNIEHDRTA